MTRPALLALLALAAVAPVAAAGPADPPPSGDGHVHVKSLKPWKAKYAYRIVRDAKAYTELNARSDVSAQVLKGSWFPIDCQMVHTTQKGDILWNHVANVGWVADRNFKTYTDGRLQGSPTCAIPGPDHVWFAQSWAAQKQYRAVHNVPIRTRPAGAQRGSERVAKGDWTTIECSGSANGKAWVRVYHRPKVGEGWIAADALRYWQKGLPAGLPRCGGSSASRHFVTLGDSYAAGIGAGSYYDGSGRCWRSSHPYWALLESQVREGLISNLGDFEACSGDTTSDLRGKLGVLNRDTALVTVSIGGNDLHFADVVRGCVEPFGK